MTPASPALDDSGPSGIVRVIEACLFASGQPMTAEALTAHVGHASPAEVRDSLNELRGHYAGRGIRLVERGKAWHFETASDLSHILRRERERLRPLSRAATEVLAIIAYHEPASRAEIEAIRGVQTSAGTLDVLLKTNWIRLAGRRETPGRPVTYATTTQFLAHFGLSHRHDLPGIAELRAAGLLDPTADIPAEPIDEAG